MDSQFLSSFLFSLSVTLPAILLVLLGMLLMKRGVINDRFCDQATQVIFNVTLPLMLFFSVYGREVDYGSQVKLISVGLVGTLILYGLGEFLAAKLIKERRERCTVVQSFYRSNASILGLALCLNAYGDIVLAPASIYSASVILLYNTLAVITLTRSLSEERTNTFIIAKKLLKNPIIIGLCLGLLVNALHIELPKPLVTTGHYLGDITLPLALICIGASIDCRKFTKISFIGKGSLSNVELLSSIGRLFIAPILMIILAKAVGIEGMSLGIIFLTTTTPLASATYAMTRAMGGNSTAVANIIGVTTLGSMLVSSIGLVVLTQLGWI
ncbi:malonate transporter [Pasteurellaceae bacterium Pebbles2]|nr:malonate transporter [Pasteurellaceae bacterium Pebbles2]